MAIFNLIDWTKLFNRNHFLNVRVNATLFKKCHPEQNIRFLCITIDGKFNGIRSVKNEKRVYEKVKGRVVAVLGYVSFPWYLP